MKMTPKDIFLADIIDNAAAEYGMTTTGAGPLENIFLTILTRGAYNLRTVKSVFRAGLINNAAPVENIKGKHYYKVYLTAAQLAAIRKIVG